MFSYLMNAFIRREDEKLNLTDFYYLSLIREEENQYSIHGLWPQNTTESYPTYCKPKAKFSMEVLNPILDKLEQYWYSNKRTIEMDEKFWEHEYMKHGTCTFSPLTEKEYFSKTIELYEKAMELNLPNKYYNEKTKKTLIPVLKDFTFYKN